jgi:transcriptional regulator with XRE-family HTH domain
MFISPIIGISIIGVNRYFDLNVTDNIGMSIGTRIKQARKQAKLTQAALAARVGLAQGTIADLEGGKSKGTTLIASFAKELGVSALWLETGKGLPDVVGAHGFAPAASHELPPSPDADESVPVTTDELDSAANDRLTSAIRLLSFFNGTDDEGRTRIMKVAERVPMVAQIAIAHSKKA